MIKFEIRVGLLMVTLMAAMWIPVSASADITNFFEWTLVQDPPDPNLTSSVDSSSRVTLRATGGPIPLGRDIAYQTINGTDVANSTSGWAFNPAFDFSVAVDFDLSFSSPSGGFSIGFGIGEDSNGFDSAGVLLASQNGGFLTFAGGARADDTDLPIAPIGIPGQLNGRFIVTYDATSGDVIVGVSTDGDDTPEGFGTFGGLQNLWDDESLLVSFFARGDNGVFPWNSGTADAVFTDFHVISGSPFAIPEPSTFSLVGLVLMLLGCVRRRSCS